MFGRGWLEQATEFEVEEETEMVVWVRAHISRWEVSVPSNCAMKGKL